MTQILAEKESCYNQLGTYFIPKGFFKKKKTKKQNTPEYRQKLNSSGYTDNH